MRKQHYYLYLTAAERQLVFYALLHFRNKLIAQGRYPDIVDEVLVKIQNLEGLGYKAFNHALGASVKTHKSKAF